MIESCRLARFAICFVKGVLVGGADDLARLIESGALGGKR
jgi:glutaredoxin-related protein